MTAPTRSAPKIRHAEILYGDDIRRVALRETGDAANWIDLVLLNSLRPPYIAESPAAGVLSYGDPIKIPAGVSTIDARDAPLDVFRTDVLVGSDRLLSVTNGDFDLVSGVPNFLQALKHHIMVEKRQLSFHPEFGCFVRRLVGRVNGPMAGQLAAFYVKSALLEDNRVASVPACIATVVGDQISVEASVVAVTGSKAELKVVI